MSTVSLGTVWGVVPVSAVATVSVHPVIHCRQMFTQFLATVAQVPQRSALLWGMRAPGSVCTGAYVLVALSASSRILGHISPDSSSSQV